MRFLATAVTALLLVAFGKADAAFPMKQAPLMTPWSSQVSPTNALPAYPRPQMVRPDWLNLNGLWEFSGAKEGEAVPVGRTLPENILVPYPVESPLSGVMRSEEWMWYRRIFTVPSGWAGRHVLLHFDAVNWKATVYVNGEEAGAHQGGYGAFSLDITSQLKPGENELIVGVYSPVDRGHQPVGKQTLVPRGYWYTASSGIWQTVWLEAVPASYITRLDMTPDVPTGKLRLIVRGANIAGQTVEAVASSGGQTVGTATGTVGNEIEIPVPNARLWSPDDPFLYDIKVSLKNGPALVDQVTGYFGMRSIAMGKVAGITRSLLNGKFVFQLGTLDQGFWPDGNYTAPTDDALKFDLEQEKKCGYNVVRKHIKVEPARWYYWADKLGILVWQDMPAMTPDGMLEDGKTPAPKHHQATPAEKAEFEAEFREMIDQLRSSPAIIGWIEFNEGWGEYSDRKEVVRLADWIKSYDPSRLLIPETGAGPSGAGDAYDWHTYPGPGSPPPSATRMAGQGEFGGVGFVIKDHSWSPVNKDQDTAANFTARYVDMIHRVKELMYSPGLSYAFFTQITDVENERNGLFTYDRAVFKGDMAAVRAVDEDVIAASRQLGEPYTASFEPHFQDASAWSVQDGTWKADGQGYTATTPGLTLARSHFNNFSAEGDVASTGGAAGLVFRFTPAAAGPESGYCASLSPDGGLTLSYDSNGSWTPVQSVPLPVAAGRTYHLRIDAFGGTIRLFVGNAQAPALEATDYRSLVGAIGLRATQAGTRFAGVKASDPFVRLEPAKIEGFVIHNSRQKDVVQVDNNVNRTDDALWQIVPGLADPHGVSFESARLPGFYLRDEAGVIAFEKDDGSDTFKDAATWKAKAGLADASGASYESHSQPGEYLQVHGRTLVRRPATSADDQEAATFLEVR